MNKNRQTFKKTSSFAGYRSGFGLYTFGINVPVKILI